MTTHLRDALHDSVASPPAETGDAVDLDTVLTAGRQRVRRRRAAAVAGVVAVTALVVGVPSALPRLEGDPAPAGPVQPVGRVVHLTDAVDARRGTDYQVLATQRSGNLDRANGIALGPLTPAGKVLAQDGPHGITNASRWGLLDPVTGRTTWLPNPDTTEPDQPSSLVGVDDRRLVLSTAGFGDERGAMTLWTSTFDGREWRRTDVDVSGTGAAFDTVRGAVLDGDRVWFAVDRPGNTAHLWSAALGADGVARDEHLDVGTFDIRDGVLTYMEHRNQPDSVLHVRNLGTGEDHAYDTQSGRGCNQLDLQDTGGRVVLSQYCGEHDGVRDDRVQVVTPTGDPVVTLQGDGVSEGYASERFVAVTSYHRGRAGVFAYDLHRDRLLRLSDQASKFAGGEGGVGDRLAWSTPILNGAGRETWVADFR